MLAGRELLEAEWKRMLSDIGGSGRTHARDIVLRGPRGVGKTVLLARLQQLAEDQGFQTISMQAFRGGPGLIYGLLARCEDPVRQTRTWDRARDALRDLAATNLPAAGRADAVARHTAVAARPLAQTLAALAREIRAQARGGGLLITLDELQVSDAFDLALLAAALQQLNVEDPDSPVAFAASALLTIDEVMREAGVCDLDRLYDIQTIPVELDRAAARYAIVEPARLRGVVWDERAVGEILTATRGYPAHLQLFADRTWKLTDGPHDITVADARRGIANAEQHVEIQTLDPRWRHATDRHVELLAALAVVTTAGSGSGYATTSEISSVLGRAVNEWSAARTHLIKESDIYAPARGLLAFTVPSYAPYVLGDYEARRAEARLNLTPLSVMLQRTRARDRSSDAQLAP